MLYARRSTFGYILIVVRDSGVGSRYVSVRYDDTSHPLSSLWLQNTCHSIPVERPTACRAIAMNKFLVLFVVHGFSVACVDVCASRLLCNRPININYTCALGVVLRVAFKSYLRTYLVSDENEI